jgi:DNA integrity scanning protein DisA with diadenylate cyclase activity
MLEQKNGDRLLELLDKNKGKNIIIVGMTLYPPAETGVKGYSIDISSDNIFYQINKKTLSDICSNCNELTELLEKEKNKYLVDLLILFKYKIRQSFPSIPYHIDNAIQMRKKHDTEIGYKYLKQEEIIEDIKKTILESNNLSRQKKLNKSKK